MLFFHFSKSISICNMNKFHFENCVNPHRCLLPTNFPNKFILFFSIKSIICLHQILFFFLSRRIMYNNRTLIRHNTTWSSGKIYNNWGEKNELCRIYFHYFFLNDCCFMCVKRKWTVSTLACQKKIGKEREKKTDSVNNKLNEWKINWSIKSMKL